MQYILFRLYLISKPVYSFNTTTTYFLSKTLALSILVTTIKYQICDHKNTVSPDGGHFHFVSPDDGLFHFVSPDGGLFHFVSPDDGLFHFISPDGVFFTLSVLMVVFFTLSDKTVHVQYDSVTTRYLFSHTKYQNSQVMV